MDPLPSPKPMPQGDTVEEKTAPRFEAPDLMICLDVITLYSANPSRGNFALLGVCWRGMPRPSVKYNARHPEQYAAQVFDWCVERGYKLAELTEWATQCYVLCNEKAGVLVSGDDLGNSDPG